MKSGTRLFVVGIMAVLLAGAAYGAARPNIIFILTDDISPRDYKFVEPYVPHYLNN